MSASLLDCIVKEVLAAIPIPIAIKRWLREQARAMEEPVLQLLHPLSAGAAGSGAGQADILVQNPLIAEDSEGSGWQE